MFALNGKEWKYNKQYNHLKRHKINLYMLNTVFYLVPQPAELLHITLDLADLVLIERITYIYWQI